MKTHCYNKLIIGKRQKKNAIRVFQKLILILIYWKETRMNIKKMTEENGITLLALVISIVVLMILATVSINALFGADGLIEQASRAKLTTEFTIFIEEKKTYDSKKTYEDSEYLGESLTAGQTTLIYNTQGEDTDGNIQSVIPSMNDDYAGKFEIIKGELLLWASSELEYEVATSLGIKVSPYIK